MAVCLSSLLSEISSPKLRDPRDNEPKIYDISGYHITLIDRLDSIVSNGLVPGKEKPSGQSFEAKYSESAVYLFLDQEVAINEMRRAYRISGGSTNFVIEVDLKVPSSHIVADEDMGHPMDTPKIIEDKGSVAVSVPINDGWFEAFHTLNLKNSYKKVKKYSEFLNVDLEKHKV